LRTDLLKSSKEVKKYLLQSILRSWPGLAEKLPGRVTEHEVAEWAHRHHADNPETYHNSCIDFLRGTFEIAIDRGIIGRNPAAKLVRASVPKTRLELPTSEQFQKIVESLARASQKVGVPKMTHHDLRHYFATKCLESGAPVATVANWLGHRDGGALLLRTYSHLLDAHSQEMAARVSF
jgi:Phage integrase family